MCGGEGGGGGGRVGGGRERQRDVFVGVCVGGIWEGGKDRERYMCVCM